ncbi:MAG: autotransporter-associated beta strand repeat-containing protein [Verrucomicrobiota bacterium]|jgi:autotransporter-associated beta strand protein
MKTKLKLLIAALCGAFVTTAAFGQGTGNASQTNLTWIATGVADVGTAANWTPIGIPVPSHANASTEYGDIMTFDGQTTGPVDATSNGGSQVGSSVGGTTAGLYLHVTANQVNRVTLHTTVAGSASSGMRFNSIGIDAGSGGLTFGTGSTTNCLDTLWGTSWPETQGLTNNSSYPAIINKDMRWRLGAGGVHTFVFGGTGDWYITNDVANVNSAGTVVTKAGSGTMYWTAGKNSYWGTETTIGTLNISGGTLVYQSSGLLQNNTTIAMSSNAAPAVFEFNVVGGSQTFNNTISGNGSVQVNNGTLTLSGANTYTGNTILSGGELIAGGNENPGVNGSLGNGGLISFTGGTLGFSSANTYDYSPRFTNSAGQAYSFDTAPAVGNPVTLTNALTSVGGTLTKLGSGPLTLGGANTYSGLTTVSAGTLEITNGAGSGAISVAGSGTLGVTEEGPQITPSTLTVSSGGALEFNSVSNTTTVPLAVVGAVSAGGPITVNITGGSFYIGGHYPLFSWGSGNPPPVVLGTLVGAVGNLSTNGNTIQLNVTGLSYKWSGLNNDNWDTTTANNWKVNGVAQIWVDGSAALFDDTVTSGNTNISLNSVVLPASTTVNCSTTPYTIATGGSGYIGGTGGFTKNGNATLWMWGSVNTYSGPTILNGGVLRVEDLENGGVASDIGMSTSDPANLVLNGGTLQAYYGGASDRLFTLGPNGGTIDDEGVQLTLTGTGAIALSGTGARTLTLAGDLMGSGLTVDTLAAFIGDNGANKTSLLKTGAGTWILTGNNTNSGAVTINAGTLQVGNGGSGSIGSGTVAINAGSAVLDFNIAGAVTNSGTISGTGSVKVDGGTVVLPANNTYSGGTTIASGSTLQMGNGGATGSLNANVAITDNGLLIFNATSTFNLTGGGISGAGNLIVRGGGQLSSVAGGTGNSYTGWTEIDPGSTFMPCQGNYGSLSSSVVTNNGTLLLVRQDNDQFIYSNPVTGSGRVWVDANNVNAGDVTLAGSCNYTGGTFIGDNGLKVGNGSGTGWITGDVTFVKSTQVPYDNPRTLTFNRPDNVTFSGNIVTNFTSPQSNLGIVVQNGTGVLTLTGNNTYGSGTTITNGGTLQVGNGGTSGSIGTGAVTDNGTLVWDRSDSVNFAAAISGVGSVVQNGAGTLTLNGTRLTYTGNTTVSNGTLVISGSSLGGSLNVSGGTLVENGAGIVGTMNVAGNMNISSGTIMAALNKSLAPSNTTFVVAGVITNSGSASLIVSNAGPDLAVGDKFTLFSQAVSNGAAITVTGGGIGITWDNNLAVDGSVTVATAPATGPGIFTNKPGITSFTMNVANVVISGTNGQAGDAYYLLASTNVALPLSQWTAVATNVLGANGSFMFIGTNVVVPNTPHQFYILSNTNH